MAGIRHTYQSPTANNPESEISSTRWNQDHTIDADTVTRAQLVPAVRDELDALAAADTSLDGRLDTAETDIITLDGRVDTAEGEIDALQAIAINHEGRIATLESSSHAAASLNNSAANYLTLVGQAFTTALINLASHVTGKLPLANLAAATAAARILGRQSGSAGDFEELTAGDNLEIVATALRLKDAVTITGAFAASNFTGSSSGTNSGDVTLAGSPDYITIAGQVITRALINLASHVTGRLPYANLTAATATDKLLGRSTTGGGDWEEIACTAAGRNLIDDASASAQRTTLGVGTGDSPTFVGLTLSGLVQMADNILQRTVLKDYGETLHAGSGTTGAVTLDITEGNYFDLTSTGNLTFTFSNPSASGVACSITVKINYGGAHTVAWPAAVRWAGSTPTPTSTNGKTDIFVFTTRDGGTKWFGAVGGLNYTT